jgi:dTDP-4-amino-4,6-dideoxygalactose transaminase
VYAIGQEEIDAVARVIRSRQLFRYRGGEGGECDRFEKALCEHVGAGHAILVTSGTVALISGLVGLGIGPGDEVIVPAYTWLASPGAVLQAGAIPVLAEVDETLTLDPDDFERKIGPRVKAVMPVHMNGRPSNMERICAIARERGIAVIEDACQAVGGSYKGRRLATIGAVGAFSFNQFKVIACGEGGAVLTGDRRIYERALIHHDLGCGFRVHAGELKETVFLGNTYRASEVLGAIMNVQLGRLDGILQGLRERRDSVAAVLRASGAPLRLTPSNDWAGDCGCGVGLIFESDARRKAVTARAAEIDARAALHSPIDSGLHVYTNWTPLLEQRGGHHPSANPFTHPANRSCRRKIRADACPRTLDILARTAVIGLNLEMDRATCDAIAGAVARAARDVPA